MYRLIFTTILVMMLLSLYGCSGHIGHGCDWYSTCGEQELPIPVKLSIKGVRK